MYSKRKYMSKHWTVSYNQKTTNVCVCVWVCLYTHVYRYKKSVFRTSISCLKIPSLISMTQATSQLHGKVFLWIIVSHSAGHESPCFYVPLTFVTIQMAVFWNTVPYSLIISQKTVLFILTLWEPGISHSLPCSQKNNATGTPIYTQVFWVASFSQAFQPKLCSHF